MMANLGLRFEFGEKEFTDFLMSENTKVISEAQLDLSYYSVF